MAIKPLTLDNGSVVYIEVESAHSGQVTEYIPSNNSAEHMPDLPPGAEATGLLDDVIIGAKLLQDTISNAAQTVQDSLKAAKPDEWSVELNIGFESTDKGIISYLGKGSGSLKVTATWKKPSATGE